MNTNNETRTETDTKQDRQATALAYAGILALAAWQAARTEGAEKTPELVAEIEKRLEAGPKTPLLALLQLIIVQTYLAEMIKVEGGNGRASQAWEHVLKAVDLLSEYEIQQTH